MYRANGIGPRCRIPWSTCSRTDTQVKERDAPNRVSTAQGSTDREKCPCLGRHSHRVALGVEGALDRRHGQIEDAGRVYPPKQQRKNIRVADARENQHESDRGKYNREETSPVL